MSDEIQEATERASTSGEPITASANLRQRALAVLRENDLGGWTRPAPRLYPHQWSWDSAFIAIGLAQVSAERALRELESLLAAQWTDGRVPQIVYNPAAPLEGYFPDAARWACAALNPAASRAPATSGLCQPPVHALAAWRIVEVAADQAEALRPRLGALYRQLLAWHRYLAERRDPERSGLLTVYHPWESGTDNSPRWDAPLANVVVGPDLPPYVRRDLQHVADPSHRPTNAEYDRYLWLVETLKRAGYDDAAVQRSHPFLVKDVLFSAVFTAACGALAQLGRWLGARDDELAELAGWRARSGSAVQGRIDRAVGLALDLDLRTGRSIPVETWAGLTPLLCDDLADEVRAALTERLFGPGFAGGPALRFAVVPSTAPGSPGFRQTTYWRGPVWPIANWLLWRGLRTQRLDDRAEALRAANLALLSQPGGELDEYFDPYSGAPLGSARQSWSAAVALDWLASAESSGPAAGPA
jgi:glucosylglycerate hydrolase